MDGSITVDWISKELLYKFAVEHSGNRGWFGYVPPISLKCDWDDCEVENCSNIDHQYDITTDCLVTKAYMLHKFVGHTTLFESIRLLPNTWDDPLDQLDTIDELCSKFTNMNYVQGYVESTPMSNCVHFFTFFSHSSTFYLVQSYANKYTSSVVEFESPRAFFEMFVYMIKYSDQTLWCKYFNNEEAETNMYNAVPLYELTFRYNVK